jgi:aspartyl/asparaginyl beta-hydroxylase (cupin superfamily)
MKKPWTTYDGNRIAADEPQTYDPRQFSWVAGVESKWETIRDELRDVLARDPDFLLPYPDPTKTDRSAAWRTAGLMYWTFESDRYVSLFPKTWAILKSVPNLTSASLLLLQARSTIKPHVGDTNAMMRCHMGLVVPAPAPRCGLRVKDTVLSWEHGKIFMFNDALEHTAWNNTDEDRYILSFDVMRPEYVAARRWVSARVLGNIFVDVRLNRSPSFRRWFGSPLGEYFMRRFGYLLFGVLMNLRLPLYRLL